MHVSSFSLLALCVACIQANPVKLLTKTGDLVHQSPAVRPLICFGGIGPHMCVLKCFANSRCRSFSYAIDVLQCCLYAGDTRTMVFRNSNHVFSEIRWWDSNIYSGCSEEQISSSNFCFRTRVRSTLKQYPQSEEFRKDSKSGPSGLMSGAITAGIQHQGTESGGKMVYYQIVKSKNILKSVDLEGNISAIIPLPRQEDFSWIDLTYGKCWQQGIDCVFILAGTKTSSRYRIHMAVVELKDVVGVRTFSLSEPKSRLFHLAYDNFRQLYLFGTNKRSNAVKLFQAPASTKPKPITRLSSYNSIDTPMRYHTPPQGALSCSTGELLLKLDQNLYLYSVQCLTMGFNVLFRPKVMAALGKKSVLVAWSLDASFYFAVDQRKQGALEIYGRVFSSPIFSTGRRMFTIGKRVMGNAAGSVLLLATSQVHRGAMYVSKARTKRSDLFLVDGNGKMLSRMTLKCKHRSSARDGLTLGGCGDVDSNHCLYIAVYLYDQLLVMPDSPVTKKQVLVLPEVIHIAKCNDCFLFSTLMMSPDGSAYAFEASVKGINVKLHRLGPGNVDMVTSCDFPGESVNPISADISPDGKELLVLVHGRIYHTMLTDLPESYCSYSSVLQQDSEESVSADAISWSRDGASFFTVTRTKQKRVVVYKHYRMKPGV